MLINTMSKLYVFCEWVMRLAYVNILWILFTLFGGIILGVFPATIALFTIIRKWLLKEIDCPIWSTFKQSYRREFLKSNKLGAIIVYIAMFIIVDFVLIKTLSSNWQSILLVPLCIIAIAYVIMLTNIFPLYVHYELKNFIATKQALFMGILNIHMTLLTLISCMGIVAFLVYQPVFLPIVGISALVEIVMVNGYYGICRINAKREIAITYSIE